MGTYAKYGYGLLVYDVSDIIKSGENIFVLEKENDTVAVYPSTLVALYNSSSSDTLKTIYLYNGADLLSNSYNFLNRTVASDSLLDIDSFSQAISSKLYVFAASAQKGDGDLIVNNKTFNNIWNGTSDSLEQYVVDLGSSPKESNEVSFVSTGSTILALEQFIVVESKFKSSEDIQKLINAAKDGSVVNLGNEIYQDVSGIIINKNITVTGGTIAGKEGSPIFIIANKSAGGPNSVNISGINFKLNNANVVVQAVAVNDSALNSIDVAAINIKGNNFTLASDKIVPESITVLKLSSQRAILAPTNNIEISGNSLSSGINPFEFDVTGFNKKDSVIIPKGGNLPDKKASIIHYEDMTTTAVNQKIEGRAGKYFEVNLTDGNGKALKDKFVQIGFNGAIYNRTTNATGGVRLQINLGYKGTYTFAISYLGDDEYNGSFEVAKIVVNTQKTKVSTSAKTFKASAKTKTLSATLKDANGKAISGKKLSFTVNGKTYVSTTNSKGVASVNVSLSSKKTYSFTVKYGGDNMYAGSSANGKVTVK